MKKILFSLIYVFLNSVLFSQNINNPEISSDLLKIYFFNGYGVIYQFDEINKASLRFHVDVTFEGSDSKINRNSKNVGDNISESELVKDNIESYLKIMISPQYYFSFISKDHLKIYSGIGPLFCFGSQTISIDEYIEDTSPPDFASYSDFESIEYELGIMAFAGFESKINNHLGIFSEIELSGGKSWNNYDRKSGQRFIPSTGSKFITDSSEEKWFYELSKIKLGIYIRL